MPASTWPGSRIPYIDEDQAPMVGAKLRFYNSGTSTPQTVYSDSGLSTPIAQPILADSRGMFTRIFLNPTPGSYRVRLTDAEDAVIFDDDDIAVAQTATYVAPDAGSTSPSLLFKTGMLQPFYGETAPTGWVRANGRTIGSASSGATERANADCQDLFLHLWAVDSTLSVSSGRGGSAASDWAANKTIALPDARLRGIIGMASMGASAATIISSALFDGGENGDILGATVGVGSHVLTITELPSHDHGGVTGDSGAHSHTYSAQNANFQSIAFGANAVSSIDNVTINTGSVGNHNHSVAAQGGGVAHPNVQPSLVSTILLKL